MHGSPVVADGAMKDGRPALSVAVQQSFRYPCCLFFRQIVGLHNP
jgi:hypothetical protein